MNLFFDVDYTILAMDSSLRPGTLETFRSLKEDGHSVYVWSGNGIRTREMEKHGLLSLLSGIYEKPLSNFEEGLTKLGVPVRPDLVVDDYQEIVSFFGGIWIAPYMFHNAEDTEMQRILRILRSVAETGTHEERGFYPQKPPRRLV